MKRLILLIVPIFIFCSICCGCKEEKSKIVDEQVPANFTGYSYLLDSWKEDAPDGTKLYYTTLLLFSDNFYAELTPDSICFNDNNEYAPLTTAIENSTVEVYNLNTNSKKGVCAVAKIKTQKLIDSKKIYALLSGPVNYEEGIRTIDEFVSNKNRQPNNKEWASMYCPISIQSIPYEKINDLTSNKKWGLLALNDSNGAIFYYNIPDSKLTYKNNVAYTKIELINLTSYDIENIKDALSRETYLAKIVNEEIQYIEDQKFKPYFNYDNDNYFIGIQCSDNKKISEIKQSAPNAIVYKSFNSPNIIELSQ